MLEEISSGEFKLSITDSENISYEYSEVIVVSSVDEFIVGSPTNLIPESCPGSEDGQFTISVSGGTAPYSYYFDNELIATNRGQTSDNSDEYTIENLKKKESMCFMQ